MTTENGQAEEIDTTTPNIARMYDYLLGGDNNFAVDREVAEKASAVVPGGIEGARRNVRADRDFLVKVVSLLAGERGMRQFLDLGTGIPNEDNVHAVAQQVAPDAKIVYVDYDPVVLAHAHVLLRSTPEGSTDFLCADVRNPGPILEKAAATLDFDQPVALIMAGILHYTADDQATYIVDTFLDNVASGSWLVVTHLASDIHPEEMARLKQVADESNTAEDVAVFRSSDGMAQLLAGLELEGPGVASLDRWLGMSGDAVPIYGVLGRKP